MWSLGILINTQREYIYICILSVYTMKKITKTKNEPTKKKKKKNTTECNGISN